MEKFILVSCVERQINVEGFFNSFEEATKEMLEQFYDCSGISPNMPYEEYDDENNYRIDKEYLSASAWCESKNHDNCDWKVEKITI